MSGILQHSGAPKGHIHGAVNWEFSTYATLLDYTVLTAQDIHKIAYVLDAGAGEAGYFILDSINTLTGEPTWVSIFGGAGVGQTNLAVGEVTTTTVQVTSDTGTDATLPAATSTTAGVATASQIAKLEAMATNAELRDRATHEGTQSVSTLSDFIESVQDLIASTLVAGSNVTLTYDDTAGTITVASSGGGGGGGGGAAVGAQVGRLAALSTLNAANTIIIFDTEIKNTDGLFSSAQPTRLTIATSGWYAITCNVRWAFSSAGSRRVYIYKNGSTYLAGAGSPASSTELSPYVCVSTVAYLDAGDYVEVMAAQSSGSTLAVDVATSVYPKFSIAKFGS